MPGPTAFARILVSGLHPELAPGRCVEVAFYQRAYVIGFGLDQQITGIVVAVAGGTVTIPNGSYAFISPGEAKAGRAADKAARRQAR